jgi:hypothetical protein
MHEAFGLVALEAMSAGTPVIASKIGGLPDIVNDDSQGILVEPGDVEALRAALAQVLDDPDLRSRLGSAARSRAESFAADLIVPLVEEAYAKVLAVRQQAKAQGRPAPIRSLAAGVQRIGRGLERREPRVILALTAIGVAGTAISAGAWTPLRTILVLPLAVFLPGYALTGAIFQRRRPALVERMVLPLSLSLVTTALASLFFYLFSFGLTLRSWVVALAVVTVSATLAAAARPSPTLDTSAPVMPPGVLRASLRPLPIAIAVAAAGLVAGAVTLARTPLPSPSAPGYTALWLTHDSSSRALILGVRSAEHRKTRYVLRLRLAGRITKRHLALAPGQTWQERLAPARQATASLYRVGHHGVYRSVRLGGNSRAVR